MGETDESLIDASIGTVIGTGLLLGIIHVLTGPDHLSALIVLSAGSSWRSCQLGMRWGCGHSTGLIVVTAIFLAVNQNFDMDTFGTYCDFIVGLLMIALGAWGLRHYLNKRREYKEEQLTRYVDEEDADEMARKSQVSHISLSRSSNMKDEPVPSPNQLEQQLTSYHKASFDETSVAKKCCFGYCTSPSPDIKNPKTQRLTAFAYGTMHGLAGTGGVLGVLPAVVLNDWGRSSAYLLSFCVASIFIMGVFAAIYGEVTGRMSRISTMFLYRVGIFSSCVSLVVGVTWVILVSTGTLDAVFG